MKRGSRRALPLIVVGAALAVVVLAIVGVEVVPGLLAKKASAVAGPPAPEQSVRIIALDPERITGIELGSARGTVKLHQDAGIWRITTPILAEVKPEAMDDLLASFSGMYSERVIEERPTDLAPYGLAKPSVDARATLTDGSTRELLLGDKTPAGTTYYLMVSGDPRVFAVWMNHGQHLSYTLNDLFQPRKTVTIDLQMLTYLRILKNGSPMIVVDRTPELVRSDVEMRTSYLSVTYPYARPKPLESFLLTDSFLTPLAEISIDEVADPAPADLARYGLDRPRYELLLKDDTTSMVLQVGRVDGERVYVRIPGERPVYSAPRALADLVARQKPSAWVSKFAAIVAMKAIDAVTITSSRGTHVLSVERTGSEAQPVETYRIDGALADSRQFKALYQQMVSVEIDSLTDEPAPGRTPDVVLAYHLLAGTAREYRVAFVPYNADFYEVVKSIAVGGQAPPEPIEGGLLVNRGQVRALLDAADALARNPGPAPAASAAP